MPTVQIEADLSSEHLLNAARQMSRQELSQFVEQVLALRARREAPVLSATESELMLKISHPIPAGLQRRYDELITRRDERTLSSAEHQELLRPTDQIELLEAERVKHLIELARLRQVSLDDVMKQLGMGPDA